MIPVGGFDPASSIGLSYSGLLLAAVRERALAVLGDYAFSGYLGPQENLWVQAISDNPRGAVARGGRSIDALAREVARDLDSLVLAIEVDADERLRIWVYDGAQELVSIDTRPPEGDPHAGAEPQIALDEFGEPVFAGAEQGFEDPSDLPEVQAATLCRAVGRPEAAEEVAETLAEELSEDESESERLRALLTKVDLPAWIVSSDSLPRSVPGGPGREEVTRLGAGRTGAAGMVAGAFFGRFRRRPRS